jgi:hypothetical protein
MALLTLVACASGAVATRDRAESVDERVDLAKA